MLANGPSVFKGGDRASFLRQLRKAACENDFPIDYTKEINGRRCINQATSEQKLWSLGLLTDSILYPYWQNRSHFDDALQDPIVLHKRLTCQAYAHAVPCSQYQIPTETLFAYEPYCCLECEAEPSMTELHREHPGYAKASPCCSTDLHSGRNFYKIHTVMLSRSSEMARAEERASILFDLATAHGSGALSMKTALVSSVGNSRSSKLRFALRPHHVLNCMALPGQAQKHVLFSIRNLQI